MVKTLSIIILTDFLKRNKKRIELSRVNYFKYERDDPHDELVIAPYLMPDLRRGDCDDFSLFAKTCLDILGGWFTHYLLLGKSTGSPTHIVVFAHRGKEICIKVSFNPSEGCT